MQTLRLHDVIDRPNPIAMLPVAGRKTATGPESALKDPMTAAIVHDLRNPLAAISACAEMLGDAELDLEQIRRLAANIRRSAGRMSELLSEFSYIMRGHSRYLELCSLAAIVAASARAAGLAERDDIELIVDVPRGIELAIVRPRIERVLINLIVNAVEAMPAGGAIWIRARGMDAQLLIEIEDSGPGVPQEIRGRLFEPFVTAKNGGLGLGLALSRETAREHGGDLWFEPAAGARFVLSLPLHGLSAS